MLPVFEFLLLFTFIGVWQIFGFLCICSHPLCQKFCMAATSVSNKVVQANIFKPLLAVVVFSVLCIVSFTYIKDIEYDVETAGFTAVLSMYITVLSVIFLIAIAIVKVLLFLWSRMHCSVV